MYNIIGHRRIFLSIAFVSVALAIAAIASFGFRESIDFREGTLWSFRAPGTDVEKVRGIIGDELKTTDIRVTTGDDGSFLVRAPEVSEETHRSLAAKISGAAPEFSELSFQTTSPSVGAALRKKAMIALGLVLLGISLYIAYAFRKVYQPISSWKYGWVTLVTLLHDVVIPAGLLAYLGHAKGIEVDTNFLVALLVVMGFSVHDTIVVFDRIRENLLKERAKANFEEIVNRSVNQTLARSINTSLTVILVLLALYFAGPLTLRYFVLTLIVGVVTGIYSSIFVASPLLIIWQKLGKKGS